MAEGDLADYRLGLTWFRPWSTLSWQRRPSERWTVAPTSLDWKKVVVVDLSRDYQVVAESPERLAPGAAVAKACEKGKSGVGHG